MSDDSGTRELERRGAIANSSMNSAMMVGIALAILSTVALIGTHWF